MRKEESCREAPALLLPLFRLLFRSFEISSNYYSPNHLYRAPLYACAQFTSYAFDHYSIDTDVAAFSLEADAGAYYTAHFL